MRRNNKKFHKKLSKVMRMNFFRVSNFILYPVSPYCGKLVNDREIRILGLQRSGNHPVIHWLFNQAEEVKCFLNSVVNNSNPFLTYQKQGTITEFKTDFFEKNNVYLERVGFFSRKKMLLYSYEDEPLEQCMSEVFEKHHDRWIGKSGKRYDMLILRDPFNLFASRLKKEYDHDGNRYSLLIPEERTVVIDLWKSYAREYLNETNYMKNNKTVINFNSWFKDQDYRKELAGKFELNHSDSSIEEVLPIGGGSSFDSIGYNKSASEMKVLERWKHFEDDEVFKSIFKDEELVSLSDRIFGRIDDVDKILS